jgi:hypothetical protein
MYSRTDDIRAKGFDEKGKPAQRKRLGGFRSISDDMESAGGMSAYSELSYSSLRITLTGSPITRINKRLDYMPMTCPDVKETEHREHTKNSKTFSWHKL